METPQSLRDSSPISGAKWFTHTNKCIVGATIARPSIFSKNRYIVGANTLHRKIYRQFKKFVFT